MKRYIIKSLVILLLITSVFQVVAISSFDLISSFRVTIAPYWIIGLFVIGFLAYLFFTDRSELYLWENSPKSIKWAFILISIFLVYTIISAFLFPWIFKGIDVLNLRLGMDAQYMNPSQLEWSFSNLGQIVYLFVNFCVFIFLIYSISSMRKLSLFFKVYWIIGVITIGFGIFQHFSVYYFPNQVYEQLYAIFHNNHLYSSLPSNTLRTNSFFGEASWFSGFAITFSIMMLTLFLYSGKKQFLLLIIMGFYSVLIALSTTGIITLVLSVLFLSLFVVVQAIRIKTKGRSIFGRLVLSLTLIAGVFVFFQQEQSLVNSFRSLLIEKNQLQKETSSISVAPRSEVDDTFMVSLSRKPLASSTNLEVDDRNFEKFVTNEPPPENDDQVDLMEQLKLYTIDKFSSLSFRNRLWADQFSVTQVLPSTYFLGAGWGSNRPSSFATFLLSNVGIIGFLSFFGFVVLLLKEFLKNFSTLEPLIISIATGFFTYLLAMIIALPDLNWPPTFWLLAGMMVAGLLIYKKETSNSHQTS